LATKAGNHHPLQFQRQGLVGFDLGFQKSTEDIQLLRQDLRLQPKTETFDVVFDFGTSV
jgi:hypothetical protein